MELYAILNYLYPQYFTTPGPFEAAFNITLNQIDPGMLLKANKLLKLFMIRRYVCCACKYIYLYLYGRGVSFILFNPSHV